MCGTQALETQSSPESEWGRNTFGKMTLERVPFENEVKKKGM